MKQETISTVLDPLNRWFFSPFLTLKYASTITNFSLLKPILPAILYQKFQVSKLSLRKFSQSGWGASKHWGNNCKIHLQFAFSQGVTIHFKICGPWIPNEGRCSSFPQRQNKGLWKELLPWVQLVLVTINLSYWFLVALVALWGWVLKKTNWLSVMCSHI